METNLREDKFILIQEAFTLGRYDAVVQESCKIFEKIMKKLFIEANANLPYEDRKKLRDAEDSLGRDNVGIEKFTFGETVGLFRTSDFFKLWGKQANRDYSLLEGINFSLVNKLRNQSAHESDKKAISKEEADYVYSNLKLFLAILGYTEYEKFISKAFEPSSKADDEDNSGKIVERERIKNTYDVSDKKEKRRLKIQKKLTKEQDMKVYSSVLDDKEKVSILDIGCNNGDFIIDRTQNLSNIDKIIGIDVNQKIIVEANEHNTTETIKFYNIDVESSDFSDDMDDILDENGIEKFDFINISMLLLHLKKPFRLLKNARKLLKKDGYLFIRDMDDGLSVAYPDTKGIVDRMVRISSKIEFTGYRENGRQLYSLLKKAGFNSIQMHYEGINTMNKSHDERDVLFMTNFNYILGDLKLAKDKYPEDQQLKKDYEWIHGAYEELEEMFQVDSFFYQMGTVVFTATN